MRPQIADAHSRLGRICFVFPTSVVTNHSLTIRLGRWFTAVLRAAEILTLARSQNAAGGHHDCAQDAVVGAAS